jgi:transposase
VAGRPTKYTAPIGQHICKLVAAGVSVEAAAATQGVTKRTVYNWRERGAAGEEPYATFNRALEKAQGDIEAALTTNVTRRSKDDWRAGAWWLERRRPEVYGDQAALDRKLHAEYVRMLDAAKRTLDPDSYKRFVAAVAAEDREE